MVMDATPSPQSVGREFVRQYYTLLNKAPDHLHRFYNNNSSFVHGGLDVHNREATMVIGQKQIYTKIQQLNFHDCHAKISQVDAQSTLGNGVVVQVTGELSNDGQPMRRFTQTFVLAAQSPKKYYVHNDIFRYQDLYSDEEADNESGGGRSENDDDGVGQVDQQLQQQQQPLLDNVGDNQQLIQQQQQIYYPVGVVSGGAQNQNFGQQQQQQQLNGGHHEELSLQKQQQHQHQQQQQQVSQSIQTAPQQQQQQQPQPMSNNQHTISSDNIITASVAVSTQLDLSDSNDLNDDSYDRTSLDQDVSVEKTVKIDPVEPIREEAPAEPKTYANLFKSEVSSGLSFASAMAGGPTLGSSQSRYGVRSTTSDTSRPTIGGAPLSDSGSNTAQSSRSATAAAPASSRSIRPIDRRPSNAQAFGDSNQLFLGNVPTQATEEELTIIFSKFGSVVELRINSKPGARSTPNYAFITYEDAKSVQNCLNHRPLYYYPDNSTEGIALNIEEKKTRPRSDNGPSGRDDRGGDRGIGGRNIPGGGGNNSGIRLGGNGPRGGGSSGGGMMRSGGGGAGGPPGGGSNGPRGSGGPPGGRGGPFNRNDSRGPAQGGSSRVGNILAQTNAPGSGPSVSSSNTFGRR